MLDQLANDWTPSLVHFDRSGEMLLAAYLADDLLVGIGGITVDPEHPEALWMRRFYICAIFRRRGIGHVIAETLL